MIDVRMCHYDLLHLEIMLRDEREHVFYVIAGIDHHGFARSLVTDDRAIALQRTDWKYFMDHFSIVAK
jgi:hypothetical protein